MRIYGLTLIPSMKSVGEIASGIWPVLWFLPIFFFKYDLDHQHLGHWMRFIEMYLGTKYEVCRWNSIRDMASSLIFLIIFWENLTLTFDLDKGQGHRNLGHWMHLIGLYLGTKYEVCRWNSIQDMVSCLVFFNPFWGKFDLDLRSRSSTLRWLNAPYWVVHCYQVWSL